MKRIVLFFIAMCGALPFARTEMRFRDYVALSKSIGVTLDDFPTECAWNGTRTAPILDTEQKRRHRSVIAETSRKEPNFNGKYVLAPFGAGTMAHSFFIIDLESGTVTEGFTYEFDLAYSVGSRLIIRNPMDSVVGYWAGELSDDEGVPAWCTTEYFLFENDSFLKVARVY